ncbi:MAG: hydrogenase iron-sulfur subunit [Candidatus Bathyarchaeia archaeon]
MIGIYICHCGRNIKGTVDVEKVKEAVSRFREVKTAETYDYLCSTPGQKIIKDGIREKGIDRVVVAACSAQLHLETFRKAVSDAGLNPYLLEMVNIREHCSWVHSDVDKATVKTIDLIRGAVNRARYLEELQTVKTPVKKDVLVVGGGITGIQASLELAAKGHKVYLVERSPSVGGHMAQLSETFPTLDCSYCILAPRMVQVSQHPNVQIITMAEPVAIKGIPGDYTVTVKLKPRYVDESKCTGCDECAKVCPVGILNEFDENLELRKAVYIPYPQAVPRVYAIDVDRCIKCFKCVDACGPRAINFSKEPEEIELNVGAIVVATGYDLIDPRHLGEYSYGTHPDIVTNLEFERIMRLGFRRPSDGKTPKKVAFILCAGSRALREGSKEYCCKIGCMVAIKQSIILMKAVTGADPWIFYQDLRAAGRGYEEFLSRAKDQGVKFIRGLPSRVIPTNNGLIVKAVDTISGVAIEENFDLVVLSAAIVPSLGTDELSKIFSISIGTDGFLLEKHYKLDPVDSLRKAIFVCGCALGPKDIRESVEGAMAAASRVASFIGKGELEHPPEVPRINMEKCNLCGECIAICPTGALMKAESTVKVVPVACINCGACVTVCPREAVDLANFTEEQFIEQIKGVCEGEIEEPKIVAFVEKSTAYASLDLAGTRRFGYISNIRPIPVPSCMRVGVKHLLTAFAYGADGIALIEGEDSPFAGEKMRQQVTRLKDKLRPYGVNPLRLQSLTTTVPQYDKTVDFLQTMSNRISRLGKISRSEREKIKSALR